MLLLRTILIAARPRPYSPRDPLSARAALPQTAQDALPDDPSTHLAAGLRPDAASKPALADSPKAPKAFRRPRRSPQPAPRTTPFSHRRRRKAAANLQPPRAIHLHRDDVSSFSAKYSNPAYLVYGTGSSLLPKAKLAKHNRSTATSAIDWVQHRISLRRSPLAGLWPEQHLRHRRLPRR